MKQTTAPRLLIAILAAPALLYLGQFINQAGASETDQKLLQFAANNVEFHRQVEASARHIYLRSGYGCPTISQIARQLPRNLSLLTFPPAPPQEPGVPPIFPAPVAGQWIEQVKLVACNKPYTINILAIGRAPQDADFPLLLGIAPGTTKIDPSVQGQAIRTGANAITRADTDGDCTHTPEVLNTRFMGYMGHERRGMSQTDTGNGWFEEWDYNFCKKNITVQMAFTPSEKNGNSINARIKTADAPEPDNKPEAKPVSSSTPEPESKPDAPAP